MAHTATAPSPTAQPGWDTTTETSYPTEDSRRQPEPGALPDAVRLLLAGVGVLPVSLIALSMFGIGLRGLATHVGVPALVVLAVVALTHRPAAGLVGAALAIGMTATGLYDLSRFGFLWAGVVHHDPIPHIGTALGLHPAVVFGYLWRYLGNGTGLCLAFLASGRRGARDGVVFGLAVCAGLVVTLAISPHGQEVLFPLGVGTLVMAITGHAIFGAVLGSLTERHARVL